MGYGFFRCFPPERFSGTLVHQARQIVEFGLADGAQVSVLDQELMQQPVGVFVRSTLPSMMQIANLSILKHAMNKKRTRRELRLSEMEAVVPWGHLLALIAPHYAQGRVEGRPSPDAAEADALGLIPAELVCLERSHGRRNAVRQ